jgi:hypothetical protein
MATDIAPIQLYVIDFQHPRFEGRIAEELQALRVSGEVRIVDSLAVARAPDGELMTARWSDLEETDGVPAGSVLAGLLGLELAQDGPLDAGKVARAIADEAPDEESRAALDAIFEVVPPGGAALLLLIEHRWALGLGRAVRDAGGELTGQRLISREMLERIPAVLEAAAAEARGA